jgi:Ca2+-binding EF-hand superfamily protein
MDRLTLLTLIASLLFTTAVYAQHKEKTPLTTEETFAAVDKNQDGYISMEEADKLKGLPEKFVAADKDNDGKLILMEFAGASIER